MPVKKEIVLSQGEVEIVPVPINKNPFRIGRTRLNHLPIQGKRIPRHQCEIIEEGGVFSLRDLSGKGTVVNGKKAKKAELNDNAVIKIGRYKLRIQDIPEESAGKKTVMLGDTDIKGSKISKGLVMALSGVVAGKPVEVMLNEFGLRIGSGPENDLVIDDPFVSKSHSRIHLENREFWIVDLESTNGTFVDGKRTKETTIWPGMVIGVGKVKLRVIDVKKDMKYPGAFGMIGKEPAMQEVFGEIEIIAGSDGTVLLIGETGSGKGDTTRAIHTMSNRSAETLVVYDCANADPNLIGSDLFGHRKGSFTDAKEDRIGVFEQADGGTLFLDEIGDLPLNMQKKLLRAIDEKEIVRVGESDPRKVDTRIIAATNRSLPDMVREGTFRQDLFYRIKVFVIEIPPLRDRPGDIPLLAKYFLEELRPGTNKKFSKRALNKLCNYDYPGNVRELMNFIVVALARSKKDTIMPDDIDITPITTADRVAEAEVSHKGKKLDNVIRQIIVEALENSKGNVTKAAKEIGKSLGVTKRLMKKLGIEKDTKFG
jgi:DNA-binding NtrC family response regulator